MASSNVDVHITEHVTTPSTVLSTATIVTSTFPHTSVISSPKLKGPKTRSSSGAYVKSTHMKVRISPNKPNTQETEHSVSSSEEKPTMPQINGATTLDSLSVPNIINLNNVENVDDWIKSGGVYVGRKVDNGHLKHDGSKWGNPHLVRVHKCREKVQELFRADILNNEDLRNDTKELKGKVLGCWCSPLKCHAEVLHEFAGNIPRYQGIDPVNNADMSPLSSTPSFPSSSALSSTDAKPLASIITSMEAHLNLQNEKIKQLEERICNLEGDLVKTNARFTIRDHVIEGLRGEIHRLQQYTRRYSVTVSGIDKERNENPKELREKVLKLVTDVKSTTQVHDIDKFHRNGRLNGKEQDIIVRFKSHSAKEAFYKARKNLLPSRKEVKIRPSLSNNQLNLLRDAKSVVEEFCLNEESTGEEMVNPVEFVFANIHGIIQAKMKKELRGSPFISFNSIPDLVRKVQEAQVVKDEDSSFDKISSWADRSITKPASGQHQSSDDDDMGFGGFS